MYIAMNRFRIKPGREADFEAIWANRDSHLDDVPGFIEFHLVRGPATEEEALYASHVLWESEQHFKDWTTSEAFRKAHANAGANGTRDVFLGPPRFEGFTVIMEQKKKA